MDMIGTGPRWARPLALIAAIAVIAWLTLFAPQRGVVAPQRGVVAPPGALSGVAAPLQGQFQAQGAPSIAAQTLPAPPAGREPVVTVGALALYTTPGASTGDDVRALAQPLREALDYVSTRTNMQLSAPVQIIFDRQAPCSLNGATYTEQRTIMLYTCPGIPSQRAVNILAHEFVHQLAYDRYGAAHMQADLILSEGLATWGAGKYWLGREPDFRSFVQRNYAPNLLPIGSHYRDYDTIDAMNRLYYEWAALVDFVISTRGQETFDALYASGHGMNPNTADYNGVLGTDLGGLEAQWKAWLSQ